MTHFYPGFHPGFHNSYQLVEIFPTYVANASTQWATTATSFTVDIPAGSVGDRLVLLFGQYAGNIVSVPSDWTSIFSGSLSVLRYRAMTRIATTAGADTVNLTGLGSGTKRGRVFVLRFSGSDAIGGVASTVNESFGGSVSYNPPNLNMGTTRMNIWIAWTVNVVGDLMSAAPSSFGTFTTLGSSDTFAAFALRSLQASSLDPGPFTAPSNSNPDVGMMATLGVVGTFVPQ